MSRHSKGAVVLAVLLGTGASGCDEKRGPLSTQAEQSRMTAEEAGYYSINWKIYTALESASKAAVRNYYSWAAEKLLHHHALADAAQKKLVESVSLKSHGVDNQNILTFRNSLAPTGFAEVHNKMLAIFGRPDGRPLDAAAITLLAEAHRAIDATVSTIRRREPEKVNREGVNIVFRPHVLPVGVGIDTSNRTFTLEVAVKTPIGDFSMQSATPEGVKLIVISQENKRRYVHVSRPFNIFIPAENGFPAISRG